MEPAEQVGQQDQDPLSQHLTPPPPTRRGSSTDPRGRRRTSGAALFGVGLLLALTGIVGACGSPVNPSEPTSGASPGGPGLLSGDAGGRLAGALGQLQNGYSFATTVRVGAQLATEADGHWIGGASEFTVTSNGVSITYRTLPPRSWVMQAGKGWVEVNGTVPSGSPLDALKSPIQTSVVSQTADTLELNASYPAAVLGLAGSAPVAVDLVVAADGSLTATYSAPTGTATSTTTIKPDASQAPIIAPSPS